MKPKVLCFIDWFLPGYKAGGQIPSLVNLINLNKDDFEFFIITSNSDLGESIPYENIIFNDWIQNFNATIYYSEISKLSFLKIKQLIKEVSPDIVYFNSIFSIKFTLFPLINSKYFLKIDNIILAPRGMLGFGALANKNKKKMAFLALSNFLGLFDNIYWHASSEFEKSEIQTYFEIKKQIRIALDLPNIPGNFDLINRRKKFINHIQLFFLSRISTKKNLLFALNSLLQVDTKFKIDFSIIGPIEEFDYWNQCEGIINSLPSNINVIIKGEIPNLKIHELLVKNEHFLFLPTKSENFGHVIAESMLAGCPVIISDQTPWKNLDEKGIGWDIPLSEPKRFIQAIETAAAIDQETYNKMSQAAFEYAKAFTSNPEVLQANRQLFKL